ncbi:hypothetical protein DPMN_124604 [Dreissena polymorpha]|uniref:Uncharacterized protein n=1 Tax=Dreissena polymorpha TaxID=45954 RepID=A0A9D4JWC3_DREPO|nr:hypothetical protein DPMN_124604 [Dreissena polymorpha]
MGEAVCSADEVSSDLKLGKTFREDRERTVPNSSKRSKVKELEQTSISSLRRSFVEPLNDEQHGCFGLENQEGWCVKTGVHTMTHG